MCARSLGFQLPLPNPKLCRISVNLLFKLSIKLLFLPIAFPQFFSGLSPGSCPGFFFKWGGVEVVKSFFVFRGGGFKNIFQDASKIWRTTSSFMIRPCRQVTGVEETAKTKEKTKEQNCELEKGFHLLATWQVTYFQKKTNHTGNQFGCGNTKGVK